MSKKEEIIYIILKWSYTKYDLLQFGAEGGLINFLKQFIGTPILIYSWLNMFTHCKFKFYLKNKSTFKCI